MADAVIPAPRPFVATLVAVTPAARMDETVSVLEVLRARSSLQTILVTLGDDPQPALERTDDATIVRGLVPRFLNNAVAALRLSSLPTIAWWRGGDTSLLPDLATLVDRLVLDADDASDAWRAVGVLADRTAIGDLRWTRLTRWRSLMAQFFDLPDVRSRAASFARLQVGAGDQQAAHLFGAWLAVRLPRGKDLDVHVSSAGEERVIERISLAGDAHTLQLRLLPDRTCIETTIERTGDPPSARVVPLGDQSLPALLTDELRVRSRDEAFEDAIHRLVAQ